MGSEGMGENGFSGLRTRSFRNEDYNNRRVFLRSYPLHWGGEDEENNEEAATKVTRKSKEDRRVKKKQIKKIILSVYHWGGGKVLVLKRFKHKFTIYIIACVPVGFKPTTGLISA